MRFEPAIVVVAFNRPDSISRLLNSLLRAKYIHDTKLVISIDNDDNRNTVVKDIALDFLWPFGSKEVIYHPQRLGLKNHVIMCGDLSEEYGSVIILEDDLMVSPYFYQYAVNALEYYSEDQNIGGISLYNQPRNELAFLPFTPIADDSDVYFLQYPSSLGQVWTKSHWLDFKNWYNQHEDLAPLVHRNMYTWPDSSWKKHFGAFLIKKDKYFVFPRISLTTNFNDPGTNLKKAVNHDGQVQLRSFDGTYRFKRIPESNCVYDKVFELLPRCAKRLEPALAEYDFEFDLYGLREVSDISTPYVITSKPSSRPIKGYRRALKPHELNVILDNPGTQIFLCRTEDIQPIENRHAQKISDYKYHYTKNILGWKVQLYRYYQRFRTKITRLL